MSKFSEKIKEFFKSLQFLLTFKFIFSRVIFTTKKTNKMLISKILQQEQVYIDRH